MAELRGIQRGIFVPVDPTQLNLIPANDAFALTLRPVWHNSGL